MVEVQPFLSPFLLEEEVCDYHMLTSNLTGQSFLMNELESCFKIEFVAYFNLKSTFFNVHVLRYAS
jgi:hypothetical protein